MAFKDDNIILKGQRNNYDGLWDVPIPQNSESSQHENGWTVVQHNRKSEKKNSSDTKAFIVNKKSKSTIIVKKERIYKQQQTSQHHQANIIIRKDKTKMELAQWLHASCGSPKPSTFCTAIEKGNFLTWPGLTSNLVKKHLPAIEATSKGHLNQ